MASALLEAVRGLPYGFKVFTYYVVFTGPLTNHTFDSVRLTLGSAASLVAASSLYRGSCGLRHGLPKRQSRSSRPRLVSPDRSHPGRFASAPTASASPPSWQMQLWARPSRSKVGHAPLASRWPKRTAPVQPMRLSVRKSLVHISVHVLRAIARRFVHMCWGR